MKILITGGTGFIGSRLADLFESNGDEITILTRSPEKYASKFPKRNFVTLEGLPSAMEGQYAVVNLAGENLFDQRWSDEIKERILKSRTRITGAIVEAINNAEKKPSVFVSASAVGFYGDNGDKKLIEEHQPGDDFLADVCVAWEEEAKNVTNDVRLVIPRIGIVMHPDGGALERFKLPFTLFAGGPIGSGDQYVPWIHLDDVLKSIQFAIHEEKARGPYNCSAPKPVTMKKLTEAIGKAMNRPSWLPVPQFALDIALGEAAKGITASMNAVPEKLQEWDFSFSHPGVDEAMRDLL
jgi:uncharacterized protein (TIGR01777 family)